MTQERLTPASIVAMLLSGFPASSGTDSDMQMGAYLIAVEGTSIEAMFRAMKAYLQQKVKRDNYAFAPSAGEFADQCRAQAWIMECESRPKIEAGPPAPEAPSVPRWKFELLQRHMKGDRSATAKLQELYPSLEVYSPPQGTSSE